LNQTILQMIRKGTKVKWKWGNGYAEGTVEVTYDTTITRAIKGNEGKRKGSHDNKALYIKQSDCAEVLKPESEVDRADD